ncbi:glycosyltransferase family 39 protein [Candidatus Parcubacteria bacterium]|nr:glycosyltransferase family 39 protein [Candidatus Parcubacteria bacterium]
MNKKKYTIIILIALFIILGSFLRLYKLSNQSYWMDEGYTVNAVISGIENGHKNFSSILDSGKTYFCPLYCYPTESITKIFGANSFSFRLISALSGILFILIIFLIVKNLFNSQIALLSSFFITFSYWQIAWSRQARWYTLFTIFFWLALFCFYKFFYNKKNKIIYLALTILFTILAVLAHKIALLLPMIMFFWVIIDCSLAKKKNIAKFIKNIILALIFFIAINLIIKYAFNINFIFAFYEKMSLHYNLPYYLSFYLRNYWFLIVLAIFAIFNSKEKKKIYFLLLPILSYLISLSFLTNIIHYRYLFHITPALYILASFGIIDIYNKIKHNLFKNIFVLALILIFFLSNGVILPRSFYLLESDDPAKLGQRPHYAYTPQPDFNSAYAIIKDNLKSNEIVISSHPHFNKIFLNRPGYWLKYSYLGIENYVSAINEDKEYYVGAKVIDDLKELKQAMKNNHGYIVFDFMSIDNRIPTEEIDYIKKNSKFIFINETNSYSKIWVYEF